MINLGMITYLLFKAKAEMLKQGERILRKHLIACFGTLFIAAIIRFMNYAFEVNIHPLIFVIPFTISSIFFCIYLHKSYIR